MRLSRSLISCAILALAACTTVGPDYHPPERVVADYWAGPAAAGPIAEEWWTRFDDSRLTALVEGASAANLDLRIARARLAEARALRDASEGRSQPQADAKGSATENRLSENGQLPIARIPGFRDDPFELFDFGFDASWELDLWGRNRREVEAAEARAGAAEASLAGALVTIRAEVARNYVDLREAQAKTESARQAAEARRRAAELVGQLYRSGEGSRLQYERALASLREAEAGVPPLAAEARAAAYRIALLIGRTSEDTVDLLQPASIPTSPPEILVGLRSELLRRRPDVREAERQLAAATAEIGVATADLFPRFRLLGSLGQQAREPGDLLSVDSTRFQIGPSFSWPVFSGGRIRAQIRASDARAEGAAARYEQAVLEALRDSETAIVRFAAAAEAAEAAAAVLVRQREAYGLAELRYRAGEDSLLALLDAEAALIAARQRTAEASAAEAKAAVSLYKALGGGWQLPVVDRGPERQL